MAVANQRSKWIRYGPHGNLQDSRDNRRPTADDHDERDAPVGDSRRFIFIGPTASDWGNYPVHLVGGIARRSTVGLGAFDKRPDLRRADRFGLIRLRRQ